MMQVNFIALMKPGQGYLITPIIFYLDVLVFAGMVISGADFLNPDLDTLLQFNTNFREDTMGGQWRRLLTCCFLHSGILHLLFNMFALLYVRMLLEPRLGN